MGKIVQTAGRNTLGEFAPEFAHSSVYMIFSCSNFSQINKFFNFCYISKIQSPTKLQMQCITPK